jgi:hypothetical protein
MKFQLGEIRQMKDPMIGLLDKDLPIKSAWKLNKLVKAFDKELAEIEEFRVGLVKKLGTEDEEGNMLVPDEKMEQFVEEFNDLLMSEIEVEFEALDIETLGDIQISAKELLPLDKIFV